MIHTSVATEIIAKVAIVSSHMPKYPIIKNEAAVPATATQLLAPNQAKAAIKIMIIGQGVFISNFSSQTRKYSSGSKKASRASP